MARITVEDCLDHVDNRFDLVMLASRRARALRNYNTVALVDEENDKPTVIALREIAKGVMSTSCWTAKKSAQRMKRLKPTSVSRTWKPTG